MALRTDYKNDVLNTAINTERQFEEVTNPNGTKSYRDVTDYSQVGDNFDADLVNTQNAEINAKAPIESPNFTGNPTAPTKSQSVEDDSLATTAFVKAALTNAIDPNLRISGKAADAKATGDKLNSIQESVPTVDTTLKTSGAAADAKVTGDSVRSILNALVSETTTEAQIASCYDAAGEFPIKRLVANIIPKQNLNGYDHPWVGGAGKNLLPLTVSAIKEANTRGSWNGNVYTDSTGFTFKLSLDSDGNVNEIIVNGTGNNTGVFYLRAHDVPNGSYTVNGVPSGASWGSNNIFRIRIGDKTDAYIRDCLSDGVTVTTANGFNLQINVAGGYTASNLTFKPMIRKSTETDATFEPYENICPISGYSAVNVYRSGKNLAEGFTLKTNVVEKVGDDSYKIIKIGSGIANRSGDADVNLKANTQYIFTCDVELNTPSIKFRAHHADGTYEDITSTITTNRSVSTPFTPSKVCDYIEAFLSSGNSNLNSYAIVSDMMLRLATETDATYEAPQIATYPITFPTATGTVYGGTLTVNSDGSGTLTVDKGFVEYNGSEDWGAYPSYNGFYRTQSDMKMGIRQDGYSNMLKDSKTSVVGQTNAFWLGVNTKSIYIIGVHDSMGDTVDAFKAYLAEHPLQLVFPLATPTTYALSAVEVAQMLQGVNNIWTDADGTLFFEYYANTALYVKKITNAQKGRIAGVEESMIATKNYAIGDLMIVGDSLYKVTAAISSGASLVIGTNITQTTVAEQLIALAKAK